MMVSGFNWSPAGQRSSRGWATCSGHDETLGCRRLAFRAQARNWSLNQGIDSGRSVPGALIGGAAEITRAFGVEHGTVKWRKISPFWFDFDRRCHSDHKPHICRHAVDINVYGYALGQAHPGEDRADGSKPALARNDVRHDDAAGYAVDMPVQHLSVTKQPNFCRIAVVNGLEGSFFEIAVHPERICIHERESSLTRRGVVPLP